MMKPEAPMRVTTTSTSHIIGFQNLTNQIMPSNILSISTAVNDQIVHFYDRSLKICRINNIAEIIISRYGAKSNSILVNVMEYDMRSTRTSIVKKWEIE